MKDYDAAGDGTTDDTAAIQAALDAACDVTARPNGARVYLPSGKYEDHGTAEDRAEQHACWLAANDFSGLHRGTRIAGCVFERISGEGILWSGLRAMIADNRFKDISRYVVRIATSNTHTDGWTTVTGNVILECGKVLSGTDSSRPTAVALGGDGYGAGKVMVTNNVLRTLYGPGICSVGGEPRDVVVEGNVVDEFGVDASGKTTDPNGFAGISVLSGKRLVVRGNYVRAADGSGHDCQRGIHTGGSSAEDTWTNDNVVLGDYSVKAFDCGWSLGVGASGNRIGLGFDSFELTTTSNLMKFMALPQIPQFTANDATPSVGGSNVWQVYNNTSTTITNFDDGVDGQLLVLFFNDALTTVQTGGSIRLAGAANFTSSSNDTMTLVRISGYWIEVARSVN